MAKGKVYKAVVMGIGDASSGTITQANMVLGYFLNNEGTVGLPLYNTVDGTGSPVLTIQPGQEIGQIMALNNGPNGLVVAFGNTPAINNAQDWVSQAAQTVMSWLPGINDATALVLTANFSDLQQVVFQDQITTQAQAVATSDTNNPSAWTTFEKVAIGGAILVGLLWGFGESVKGKNA